MLQYSLNWVICVIFASDKPQYQYPISKNGLPLETIAKIAEMTVDKIKHLIQNS